MSIFSDHLNELIQAGHLTLQYLEKESGFSLALISKIKTGKRLPESEEKMMRLIKALHCSITQEEALLKDYRIEKMGREKYLCMEESRKTLEAISYYPAPFIVDRKTEYTFDNRQAIHGLPNINMLVQYVIDIEAENAGGSLKMIIQPDYTFLKDYLLGALSGKHRANLHLEHIIALYGTDVPLADQKNMKTAGCCLHLSSIYNKSYQVYYHYKTDFASDIFPFCILTSRYGILVSADCQTALFFHEKDVLLSLEQMFAGLKSKCRPLLETMNTPVEYLQSYEKNIYIKEAAAHSVVEVSYVPCIIPNISQQAAMKHIHPELVKQPYIMDFLKTYWSNHCTYLNIITIFSLKGLELFMKTGICYELPRDSHSPFSMEERMQILRGFLQDSIQGTLTPILLKDNRINISPELYLSIYNKTDVHFLWNLQNVSFSSCMIQESGIRKSLSDFLSYIRTTEEDTYSKEESLIMIKEFCRQYFKI